MAIKKTATAPYNFIPLPDEIIYRYDSLKDLPKHHHFYSDKHTGVIGYTLTTETPTLIGDGNGEFFKVGNVLTIPGSTLRGLVRTNAEILSYSSPEFVEDKQFTYREVGSRAQLSITKDYKNFLDTSIKKRINQIVKAGLLIKHQNEFYIKPLNGYIYKEERYHFSRIKNDVIDALIKETDRGFTSNLSLKDRAYKPYMKKVRFEEANKDNITLDRKSGVHPECKMRGYLLNSNAFVAGGDRSKKSHYLFKAEALKGNDIKEHLKIPSSVVNAYKTHYVKSNNQSHKQDEYFGLPSKNTIADLKTLDITNVFDNCDFDQAKPVFYLSTVTGNQEVINAIGFTPYMRIPYKNNLKKGINFAQTGSGIDYTNALFGFTNQEESGGKSYKGRVYFKNARLLSENSDVKTYKIKKPLITPKPTSFQLYLEQNQGETVEERDLVTYNTEGFKLRGYKYYWLKEKADLVTVERDFAAPMSPIVAGTEFNGSVHFENLTDDELGLLLLSLNPFEEGHFNIGQGKPYGFGRAKLKINEFKIFKKERFSQFGGPLFSEGSLNSDEAKTPKLEERITSYKEKYEEYFKDKYKRELHDLNNLRFWAFYMSKNLVTQPIDEQEYKYMELKQFKDREILKSAPEYLKTYDDYKTLVDLDKYITESNEKTEQAIRVIQKSEVMAFEPKICVLSDKMDGGNGLKLMFNDIKNVVYVERKDFVLSDHDIILFNNLKEVEYIRNIIMADQNSDRVYLYFSEYGGRFEPINGKYIHFSNGIMTINGGLKQAIQVVQSYRVKSK